MQTTDGRLKIFNCNLFSVDPLICGTFDGIWDRGSLVAISPDDRKRYANSLVQYYMLEIIFFLLKFPKGILFY